MPSSYPVQSRALPVSAGMIVAVPLELLASPLKNGRDLGDGGRSALVVGGTEKVRTGGAVVFCKVVVVAEAQVKRDGRVRAKGSPVRRGLSADDPTAIERVSAELRVSASSLIDRLYNLDELTFDDRIRLRSIWLPPHHQ